MSRDESPMDEEVIPGHLLNLMCAIHTRVGSHARNDLGLEVAHPSVDLGDADHLG